MPWRENKGVCQFKRILDGCFFGLLRKKSLGEILFKMLPTARNQSSELRRILDGCFLGLLRKKSLGEILFKMLLRKKYFREIAILNRFLDRLGP